MKLRVFSIFAIVPAIFFMANFTHADRWQFTRTLHVGSRGPDVFALQKFLNENTQTRVAERGIGSLGKETNYFGAATARAVAAFQQQNSIAGETGRVGPITLGVLNKRIVAQQKVPPTTTPRILGTPPQAGGDAKTTHPNARNLEQFLGMVKQVGGAQGYAQDKLETLAKEVSSFALGTTTDFFAQFAKEVNVNAKKTSLESPLWNGIAKSLKKIAGIFVLRADAQAPSFGGMVVYVFPCTCSGNWLMGLVPLSVPPIVLMTHYPGSQTFANFNAPFTLFLLGNYIPGGAPCLFEAGPICIDIPSQAQTSPVLGSS